MTGFNLGGPEGIILLIVVLVLFGGSQIPKLARNLGRAQKEFKDGIEEGSRSAGQSPAAVPPAQSGSVTDTESKP